jgi:predicted phosphoribosyltransferase
LNGSRYARADSELSSLPIGLFGASTGAAAALVAAAQLPQEIAAVDSRKALRRRKPRALVLAVPVAPADTVEAGK